MTFSVVDNGFDTCRDMSFVAVTPIMQRLRDQARRIAAIDVPVLCLGESGTGKEVVARLIHSLSRRAGRTFLKVNCAALPSELLESELFGYEAGAFTGAVRAKPGKFELCPNGTILLDEIGDMQPPLQAKLLHVLEDHSFARLGGRSRIHVDVRMIAATNIDIEAAVVNRTFRQDLYYRLSTVVLRIPPLRERREDIPVLLEHFIRRFTTHGGMSPKPVTPAVLDLCNSYAWPGNVRELENFVQRYLILDAEDVMLEEPFRSSRNGTHARAAVAGPPTEAATGLKSAVRTIRDEAERAAIEEALAQTNWNRKQAARLLQISYKTLLNKVRQHQLGFRRTDSGPHDAG